MMSPVKYAWIRIRCWLQRKPIEECLKEYKTEEQIKEEVAAQHKIRGLGAPVDLTPIIIRQNRMVAQLTSLGIDQETVEERDKEIRQRIAIEASSIGFRQ